MLRNLTLTRSLAVIDTETTGLLCNNPRVVEIAIVTVHPDLSVDAIVRRLNPGRPIPQEATAVHGIRDEDVADCPTFEAAAEETDRMLIDCDLSGFNLLGFDIPVIDGELRRIGTPPGWTNNRIILDVMELVHQFVPMGMYGRPARGTGTLSAACRDYLGGWFHGAHGALANALATLRVLDAMIPVHALPTNFLDLAREARRMRRESLPMGVEP